MLSLCRPLSLLVTLRCDSLDAEGIRGRMSVWGLKSLTGFGVVRLCKAQMDTPLTDPKRLRSTRQNRKVTETEREKSSGGSRPFRAGHPLRSCVPPVLCPRASTRAPDKGGQGYRPPLALP